MEFWVNLNLMFGLLGEICSLHSESFQCKYKFSDLWKYEILHHYYNKKTLVLQSLLRLKEPSVLLRCRKDDMHLVNSVLHSAKEEYAEKAHVHPPEVIIDHIHLPPAPSHHDAHGPFWY